MEVLARARIVGWEGASLWVVEVAPAIALGQRQTDFHSHHAIQLTISLEGAFDLGADGRRLGGEGAAVAADAAHDYRAEGLQALAFVEPESRAGRAIAAKILGDAPLGVIAPDDLRAFRQAVTEAFRRGDSDEVLIGHGRALVGRLAGHAAAPPPDPRVRRLIAWAAEHIDEPVSLADAVGVTNLSAGRLRHLFVEETGLAFRTYLLWLRLNRAVTACAGGLSLTQAAHEAGFADSAHFSRTFRRMFGIAPASLKMT